MKIVIKNAVEIEKMRAAGRAASQILEEVSKALQPGVSTLEMDQLAAKLMKEAGCTSAFLNYRAGSTNTPFPGNICISLNNEVVHGIGSQARRIQYGDIVKLDVGVFKDGWVGDTAKTVPIGVVDPEIQRLLQVTEGALEKSIPFARQGNRLHDISGTIQDFVESNGFSVVREFVGHGVGRHLHEDPQVPNYRTGPNPKLRAGMTIAVEPMVNMGKAPVRVLDDHWTVVTADGLPSAHFEHTILITEAEPEILTWRERTL